MKWTLVLSHRDGTFEKDSTHGNRAEAEARAAKAALYWEPFGTMVMVLPATVAAKIKA